MKIQVIATSSTSKPTKNGSYTMLEVTYKNLDSGKTDGKKIMSFAQKEVFAVLSKANNGDVFSVTTKKNEQSGYWDWVDVVKADAGGSNTPEAPKSFASPKSTYETPEERAQRQVYIIRQSSLTNAISVLKTEKTSPSKDDVFKLAQEMVDWVMQKEAPPDIFDMDDDIPL